MWCCQCQQETPAAREASGPPACIRCGEPFAQRAPTGVTVASVSDCGLELHAFTQRAEPSSKMLERPRCDPRAADLRRLERILRPTLRFDDRASRSWMQPAHRAYEPVSTDEARWSPPPVVIRPAPAWGLSLLLAAGGSVLVSGLLLLAAANLLLHAAAWRWGFAFTVAGEGLLIAGLASLAARLWRNSRRLNSQLEGIDCRLGHVQSAVERTSPPPHALHGDRANWDSLAFT